MEKKVISGINFGCNKSELGNIQDSINPRTTSKSTSNAPSPKPPKK